MNMIDRSNSRSQSNPAFGRVAYVSDNEDLAKHGFITPMNLVYVRGIEKKTGNYVAYKDDYEERVKDFVDNLMYISELHDQTIQKDSGGRRRGFLFVTVPSNNYLEEIYTSSKFLAWANANKVGVYMTSAGTDNELYLGEGRIKKAESLTWAKRVTNSGTYEAFKINEFIGILNGEAESEDCEEFVLTKEEINSHMNILININQCNSGINLPSLNGAYFARYFQKDMPDTIQVPGRTCRADSEDVAKVGKIENCPCVNPNHGYVKPYSYIYVCLDEFAPDQLHDIHEAVQFFYRDYYMAKTYVNTPERGLRNDDNEPKNSDKEPEDIVAASSYELKDFESVNVDLLAMVLSNNEGFTKECMDQIMNANDKIDEYPEIFNEHIEENEIEFYIDMYSCLFKKYECNMRNLERYAEMIRTKIETFAEE